MLLQTVFLMSIIKNVSNYESIAISFQLKLHEGFKVSHYYLLSF